MQLALFDLDHTLLDGDSDLVWTEMLAERGLIDVERMRAFHADYENGRLDIDAFLAFQLAPLAAHPPATLRAWRAEFVARARPHLGEAARALVARHAALSHELVLITATNRFLAEPLARELGIAHLVATEPVRENGSYTGRYEPPACFREGKVRRLERWLAARGSAWSDVRESWFYSDSHNDLPLFERVDHPVAVDPDPELEARARARGWPVLALHSRGR